MSTFAQDLSRRLTGHASFWTYLGQLQGAGAARTLARPLDDAPTLDIDKVLKLLYCASVFVQTDADELKRLAQAIVLNTLLLHEDGELRERSLHVLTELGNFPGLSYAERAYGTGDQTLLGRMNRQVSQALNTVAINGLPVALTDYQKQVWDRLPITRALAISAPTSAGKSYVVIEHLCQQAEKHQHFTAVYIAPTRALLSEVQQKIQLRLKGRDEIRISTVPSLDPLQRTCQVFVLTQERLQVLLSIYGAAFNVVVVDEAQNLSDHARGMILQDCLQTLMSRSSTTQLVMLAPGATGLPEIAKAIGVDALRPEFTGVSPVLQNRIVVSKVKGSPNEMRLQLLRGPEERVEIGNLVSSLGLDNKATRLAAIALELGGGEGSLVYETGPREAEKTALQLMNELRRSPPDPQDQALLDLSEFIKEHIHPEYQLAAMVTHGVAYHYGRMPSLLREAIESSFKQTRTGLHYLVCTTTLAQGINLPARNVFIDTPKRGRGENLDPALLWNFAGRAGRLSQDIVGNVFLLDYDEWDTRPMDDFVPFEVKSAITTTLSQQFDRVMGAVRGNMPVALPWNAEATRIKACAGLLIAKAAEGISDKFLASVLPPDRQDSAAEVSESAVGAAQSIGLPASLLHANWTIDPYGLRRLYDRLLEKIDSDDLSDVIPLNPREAPEGLYQSIFKRILRTVDKQQGNFGALVAGLAIQWMKGMPYPVILKYWVKRARLAEERDAQKAAEAGTRPKRPRTVDALIREAFDLIEDVVRFRFVQLGKAYRDLLVLALQEKGLHKRVPEVYDFALALELGVSTETGTAFVELGLSRIAASALEDLFPSSSMTVAEARQALRTLDVVANKLNPIIVGELDRLGLRDPIEG
ncbi:DEAD/DEAH box helicase [Pseudomonas sp. AF1]|uniref:DEAD/DEAH box helicase n=1 Tax=unclassified Pseudomonas TaxID=196821 RepID=UPI00193B5CB9|nr:MULTISPECIES: DEAD/DEAH box helicase [unclassified Pseudomonas]MBM2562131.1 DEAD/DEAH box helicase [Pseudomonas sp. AF1]MBM2583114.1 DEAD/DEAH box helicase [Pseudomonas sp. AFW1]MBM2593908.1 DEAD/DEAH box helicase [Pseudomonas sp. BIS]MBM2603049.1 DEAD/DEAH box helicase [Pseudomonas sp. BIS1]